MTDNNKNKETQSLSRFIHCLILSLFLLPLMGGIVSCGNDDGEEEPTINPASILYGAWTIEKTIIEDDGHRTVEEITILFDNQDHLKGNTKTVVSGPGNAAVITGSFEYRYKVLGNTINLYKVDANDNQPWSILSYSIKNDILDL